MKLNFLILFFFIGGLIMCQEYLLKGHIFDLLNLKEISFKKEGNEAVLDISVDPHDVLCFLITPKRMELKLEGDKIRVNLPGVKAKELWVAVIDEEGIRRDIRRFPVKGKEIVIEREKPSLNARKFLLRLPLPHSTEDIASVVF